MFGIGSRSEDPIIGRGNPCLAHQVLGEDLGTFQLGGVLARSEDAQALPLKDVHDPLGQRLFRADHGQADALTPGKLQQAPLIARFNGHVLHVERRSRVARSTENRGHPRRLLQFPAQGVLTPSLADHQNFQPRDSPE